MDEDGYGPPILTSRDALCAADQPRSEWEVSAGSVRSFLQIATPNRIVGIRPHPNTISRNLGRYGQCRPDSISILR